MKVKFKVSIVLNNNVELKASPSFTVEDIGNPEAFRISHINVYQQIKGGYILTKTIEVEK